MPTKEFFDEIINDCIDKYINIPYEDYDTFEIYNMEKFLMYYMGKIGSKRYFELQMLAGVEVGFFCPDDGFKKVVELVSQEFRQRCVDGIISLYGNRRFKRKKTVKIKKILKKKSY